jgi:hypothetical protein
MVYVERGEFGKAIKLSVNKKARDAMLKTARRYESHRRPTEIRRYKRASASGLLENTSSQPYFKAVERHELKKTPYKVSSTKPVEVVDAALMRHMYCSGPLLKL